MQAPNWADFLQCSVCTNKYDASQVVPISLSCGHTLCKKCLTKLKTRTCPYDKTSVSPNVESLPPNNALLQLLGQKIDENNADLSQLNLSEGDCEQFKESRSSIEELALFLQPLAEQGITAAVSHLTRPMLKKLVTVVNCQVLESEGRARALRAARSIADRTVTELLVMHQNQQQISTLLWTAVRNRGCQFLGPVMQEEALKLILKVLEIGKFLSRKTIVLYVVQQLQQDFPQASKTCVGHVVQLLYRASCFNVEKREDDSSLMQLKEEFRSYESLRREHDAQIIRMAMEAGLRISPEQWSTLLYGNHKHKSDMQSIIDKLIAQGAASSGLNELIVAIGRSQDPYSLSEKLIPHLEVLLKIDINIDKSSELVSSWQMFAVSMKALLATLQGFSTFMQIQSGRYKTGMCSNLGKVGGCPKGDKCTYAHSEEERDRFRSILKSNKPKSLTNPKSVTAPVMRVTPGLPVMTSRGRMSGDLGPVKLDTSPLSSLGYDGYPTSYVPGMQDSYESLDHAGYPSYGAGDHIVLQSTVPVAPSHSSLPILQSHGGQVYPTAAPQPQQLVGYPSTSHRHSGPVAMATEQIYNGSQMVSMDTYYPATTSRRSGPMAEVELSRVYGSGGVVPSYVDMGAQYHHHMVEGTGSSVPSAYNVKMVSSSGGSMIAGSLQSIRKMHETVKKSIEASSRTQTPTTSSDATYDYPSSTAVGNTHTSNGGYTADPGRMENARVAYPPSSIAEEWKYIERAKLVPPSSSSSSSSSLRPAENIATSTYHSLDTSGKSLPTSSVPGYYPASSGGYTSSANELTESGPSLSSQGGGPALSSQGGTSGVRMAYEYEVLHDRLSSLAVTSASEYPSTHAHQSPTPASYPVSTSALESTYNPTMADSHSVPMASPVLRPGSYSSSPVPDSYISPEFSRGAEEQQLPDYSYSSAVTSVETSKTITTISNVSSQSSRSTEDELRDRIKQLEQELKQKDAAIEQKDAAIEQQKRHQTSSYTSPSKVYQNTTSPIHSGPISVHSSHHSGPIHHSSFSGPIQLHYSPHNTMQQYPSSGSYYVPPNPAPHSYPHQWSGPLSTPLSGPPSGQFASGLSRAASLQHTTPPNTGLLVHPTATGGRIVPVMQKTHHQDLHPEDGMIAQYVQVMEQHKAAQYAAYPSEYYIPAAYATVQPTPQQYMYKYY